MTEDRLLDVIAVAGLILGFGSGLLSQFFRTDPAVDGAGRRRLTAAGYFALAISAAGLIGSVGSVALQAHIKETDRKAREVADQQEEARKNQEAEWKQATKALLDDARDKIEKNLKTTLNGFRDSQARLLKTEQSVITARQRILERQISDTTLIRAQEARNSSLALESVWDAATMVDLTRMALVVFNECADASEKGMYVGATAEIKVVQPKPGVEPRGPKLWEVLDDYPGLALQSLREPRIRASVDNDNAVFEGFVTQDPLGRYATLDGWRGSLIQIGLEGEDEMDAKQLKARFPHANLGKVVNDDGEEISYPQGFHPASNCQANLILMVGGTVVANSYAVPLVEEIRPGAYALRVASEPTGITEANLPEFQAAPASERGIRRKPLTQAPPPPPPPPPRQGAG